MYDYHKLGLQLFLENTKALAPGSHFERPSLGPKVRISYSRFITMMSKYFTGGRALCCQVDRRHGVWYLHIWGAPRDRRERLPGFKERAWSYHLRDAVKSGVPPVAVKTCRELFHLDLDDDTKFFQLPHPPR